MLKKLIKDIHALCLVVYKEGLSKRDKEHLQERSVEELKSLKQMLQERMCLEVAGE